MSQQFQFDVDNINENLSKDNSGGFKLVSPDHPTLMVIRSVKQDNFEGKPTLEWEFEHKGELHKLFDTWYFDQVHVQGKPEYTNSINLLVNFLSLGLGFSAEDISTRMNTLCQMIMANKVNIEKALQLHLNQLIGREVTLYVKYKKAKSNSGLFGTKVKKNKKGYLNFDTTIREFFHGKEDLTQMIDRSELIQLLSQNNNTGFVVNGSFHKWEDFDILNTMDGQGNAPDFDGIPTPTDPYSGQPSYNIPNNDFYNAGF